MHFSCVALATILIAGASLSSSSSINYSGYKVFRYVPQNLEDVAALQELEATGVRFWDGPGGIRKSADVMFAPHQLGFVQGLEERGLYAVEYISDVQKLIDQESSGIKTKALGMTWTDYSTPETIEEWLELLSVENPDTVQLSTIGKSYEGRNLTLIKISTSNSTETPKPIVFIDSNIHAREWITSAVTTYVINELVKGNKTKVQSYLDHFDIHILPVLNPDGFAFTHSEDRLWRKTRSNTTSLVGCKGADPNRNFDFHWLDGGSSTNPCSDLYAGPEALSEPETLSLSNYLRSIRSRLVFYLSVHSYGHFILIPYGHSNETIPEYEEYMRIGQNAADAIVERFGKVFTPGNVVDLLYVASGESFDWVKGRLNPYLSYGIELRDQGNFGFILPKEEIIPSSQEFLDGLCVFLEEVKKGTSNSTASTVPEKIPEKVLEIDPELENFGSVPVNPRQGPSPLLFLQREV